MISRLAPHIQSPHRELTLAVGLGLAAFIGLALLGHRTRGDLLLALVASLGAFATAWLAVRSPVTAFGLLLILASMSSLVIVLPFGRVRLEQPSVIAGLVALVATRGLPRRSDLALVLPIAVSFALYLIVLTLASVMHAPQPAVSARLIIWTTLSMCAGVVAFVLVRRSKGQGDGWITVTGVAHATVGVAVATAFLLLGPTSIPGMQTGIGEAPKVAGLAFEANLYASMLGACAPFAIERFRSRRDTASAVAMLLIIIGLGLGVTRGAYLGLGAGLAVYLAVIAYRRRPRTEIFPVLSILAIALLLAPSIAWATLPVVRDSSATASASARATNPASGSSGSRRPLPTSTTVQTPSPAPSPVTDTLAFRLGRVPVALDDLEKSPIVGLGAASFGQRHPVPDRGVPDYISILALSAVYEAGVVGAAALAIGFLLSLRLIFRASGGNPGLAAAYVASIVSLLVAYQASNAVFFSIGWIILGAGLAVAVRTIQGVTAPTVPPA